MNIVRARYGGYEGPMFPGSARVEVSPASSPLHKLVGVTTATEGGCYDSMNGYDRCILSLGCIQFCGAIGILHPLMRKILEGTPSSAQEELRKWQEKYGVELLPSLLTPTAPSLAQNLYGCNGREGSWGPSNWERAFALFRALRPLLIDPQAQSIQLEHTASRILSFVMPATSRILFSGGLAEGWIGALQAAVVSFSANLPAVADRHFRAYVDSKGSPVATKEYVQGAIDAMTFGPNIAIYPHRRKAILPVISRLYGVPLAETPPPPSPTHVTMSTKEVQERLISLGYDLGPAKADGVLGSKTREAIKEFQRKNGLIPDGIVGPKTLAILAKAGD